MDKISIPSRALFVKDIPQNISHHSFEDLFKSLPGYITMRRKPHFAFVEFKDIEFATMAMIKYQGYRFGSTDKPIVIDFDKDRSDDKREFRDRDYRDNRVYRDGREFRDHREFRDRDFRDFRDNRDGRFKAGRDNHFRDFREERDIHHQHHHQHHHPQPNFSDRDSYHLRDSDYNENKKRKSEDEESRDDIDRASHNSDRSSEDNNDSTNIDEKNKESSSSSTTTPSSFKRYRHEDGHRPSYDRYDKHHSSSHYRDSYQNNNGYQSHLNTPNHSSNNSPLLPPSYHYSHPPPHHNRAGFANAPCSTLFVSNLPKDVTERELSILFRFMAGFVSFRIIYKDGKLPMCFCDFVDTPSASIALDFLQGFRMDPKDISSSISIEFDKDNSIKK